METLIFDQLNQNQSVGDDLITVNTRVQNDFQIQCYRNDYDEQQVGETICLHSAFIEESYLRVSLTEDLSLDLFFTEAENNQHDLDEEALIEQLNRKADYDNFWLTISSQIIRFQQHDPDLVSRASEQYKSQASFESEEFFDVDIAAEEQPFEIIDSPEKSNKVYPAKDKRKSNLRARFSNKKKQEKLPDNDTI